MRTVAALAALAVLLAGCGDADDETPPVPARPANEQVALDAVAPACSETPDKLDGEASNAVGLLAERGVDDETTTTVLRHLRDSIPPTAPVMYCAELLADYIQMRAPQS